ncbi:MAG TPA: hypothetical protein VHP36_06825 [Chitinispirillaceae bacterium]|nr:hypothetical protein [Chitinispirillaceae bacterium]
MKNILMIHIILVSVGLVFSKNSVRLNPSVVNYVDSFEKRSTNGHRSGLIHGEDMTFDKSYDKSDLIKENWCSESGNNISNVWRSNYAGSYVISNYQMDPQMLKFLQKKMAKSGLTVEKYTSGDFTYHFQAPKKELNISKLPYSGIDELKETVRSAVKKHLKAFEGKIEYDNYELTSVDFANSKKVTSLGIRFRRIFNGGIILRDASYIYLVLNGMGELKEISIKWPTLVPANETIRTIPFKKGMDQAVQYYNNLPQATSNNVEHPIVNVKDVEITSAALGWLPHPNEDGVETLLPVYSFIGKVALDNNDTCYRLFEVPIFEGYEREE